MSAIDGLPDEPNPDLCMCRVEEYDGGPPGPLLVWRPCPPDLCERHDAAHSGVSHCSCTDCKKQDGPCRCGDTLGCAC